ncbi:hypothetical protein GCM10009801_51180 [Streptomyces albiaxialis]|uniref:Molecular chaperone DnaJ n=1 Tax=Streptomyces albiaxialis TaxID=329523 RepID=A0ABN2WBG1_9ACTN
MAAKRKTAAKKPCGPCKGTGEASVRVVVGARRKRTTEHQQTGMCLNCLGTGEDPN